MKNILLFFMLITLVSCEDEIHPIQHDDTIIIQEQTPETPPEGLKLKSRNGLIREQYFYHSNGFVDSIRSDHGWYGNGHTTKKYIYNNLNHIVERRDTYVSEYNKKETTYYTYNATNQIISSSTYDENNVAIAYKTYNYNNDGTLVSPNMIIVNGNVVQDGSITYQFDNLRNPYYNIYPKAYRILNSLNQNNILITESNYGNNVYTNIHTLEYNSENYIISEEISNMPLDTDDRRRFSYY